MGIRIKGWELLFGILMEGALIERKGTCWALVEGYALNLVMELYNVAHLTCM